MRRLVCAVLGHRIFVSPWLPSQNGGWHRFKDCQRCGNTAMEMTFRGDAAPLNVTGGDR